MIERDPSADRFLEARDVVRLAALTVLAPVAVLVPERRWGSVGRATERFLRGVLPRARTTRVEQIGRITQGRPDLPDAERIDRQVIAGRVEQELMYLRELFRPNPSEPRVSIVGDGHIESALARGHGCILWVAPFLFSSLLVKKGLRQAGLDVLHLSYYRHGPSNSRLGHVLINLMRTRGEDRYLTERLSMAPGTELSCLRSLERELRANHVVSISVAHLGHRTVDLTVLDGRLCVGTGAPSLAVATGAALLPVFGHGPRPGGFEIDIEPAMEPLGASRGRAATDDLLERYADLLESYVVRFPSSFSVWSSLSADRASRHP